MDPVDPFFDSGAWMREYAALQGRTGQRAGSPSEQGDFEGRLQDLTLDPSDQRNSTSPDRPPAAGGRAVRRDDFGGSMRAPPRSTSRESALGGTRRSVDIPSLQLPASSQVPQSGLRDDLFSSTRYSFPDAASAASAKSGKSRGLWSRFKSGLGKALGGSGSEKSSRDAGQSDVISTNLRIDHARQPGRTRGVSRADEELIEDFRNKAAGNLSDGTIKNAAADLRHLSARLSDAGRPSIADRIRRELENAQLENPDVENHQLEAELDEDVDTYAKDRGRRIKAALKKLRDVGAGNTLAADVRRLAPHAEDASFIRMWAAAEKATGRIDPKTIDRQTRRMFRLSEWLQTHDRQPIAGRLSTPGLAQDLAEYTQETEDSKINADLVRLGLYQQILEANRALGLPPPEDAGQPSGLAAPQAHSPQEFPATPATPSAGAWQWLGEQMHGPGSSMPAPHSGWQTSSSQPLPATPATPSAGAWDWLGEQIHGPASPMPAPHWVAQAHPPFELPATPATPSQGAWAWLGQQMQEPASPSSVRPRSSNIYGDLESFVDLDPPTPHDLRDDARSAPPEFAAASSFAGPPGVTPELRDIGAIVGANWHHGSQAASDVLIDVLGNINLLPNQFGPSQFAINGERYSATFGPGGRRDIRLIHHPRVGGMNEAGPSRPLHPPQPIVSVRRPGEGAVDLGSLIRGGWEHRERFLPPYLVRVLEGERIMPGPGRPSYFKIRGVPYRGELVESEGRQRVRVYPESN
ncbi:hypothetical protein J2R76_003650 [Bradyrhizobium sp. USDA 4532]|uniref:hypothetical protein n=1 Tax=unclassified Bradyrhizobium TaxID=2631580 RepID=UPI00209F495E|nr:MULTISPECIES: hypothetical protein [unclassified Bradyrhizobium]MCP1835313.1 hypothetical protein [Bradyrhizobium sp. USDA 4545]MCP1920059.1 hypothetical protein [Bradyrhizobium sp. USDA 4532]